MRNICYDEFGNLINELTQWDSNRSIVLKDYEYNVAPIFHFSNPNDSESLVVESNITNGDVIVQIPNSLLRKDKPIIVNVFHYNASTDSGRNIYTIILPVRPKAKPNDYVYVDDTDIIELSTLKQQLQTLIANAQIEVNNAINTMNQNYQTVIGELKESYEQTEQDLTDEINNKEVVLENKIDQALEQTINSMQGFTPKSIFSDVSELNGQASGIYLYYNSSDTLDENNGYIFYWNGTSLSDRILLYNGIAIGDNTITYAMLSNELKYDAIEGNRIFVTQELAETYLQSIYAKAGQSIKILEDGKYKLYLIQNSDDGFYLSPINASTYIGNSLPELSSADKDTDYYIKENGSYIHYRVIEDKFIPVGGDSYTKNEIDNLLNTLNETVETNSNNLQDLTESLQHITEEISNLSGYTYYATYGKMKLKDDDLEETDNVFALHEVSPDGTETIKSRFVITGGSGGSSATTNLIVEKITNSPLAVVNGDKVNIVINFSSTDTDGDAVDGSYSLKVGNSTVMSGSLVQGRNTFDITNFCVVGTQKITLTVTDDGGNISVKTWNVQIIDISIDTTFNAGVIKNIDTIVNFPYTVYGNINKIIHFKMDGVEIGRNETTLSGASLSFPIPPQEYGSHLFECYITATINGNEIESNHIFKDIMYYDGIDTTPIISCIYRNDYYGNLSTKQYNTINIDYIAYNPLTPTPNVTITVDGDVVENAQLQSSVGNYAFKSSDIGLHSIVISCGETSVTIKINVEDLGYDIEAITDNLAFDFDPNGYSNQSINRLWQDRTNPNIKMSVSDNFDWNNGGYQLDENNNQYFCVKAGTRATINYKLFGDKEMFVAGKQFKMLFKTTNVRKSNAQFLTCISTDENDVVGFKMNVHEAYLSTSADELYIPYCEEDIMSIEFNIKPIETDIDENNNVIPKEGAESFIMSYEDGTGLRPLIYDSTHRLYQYDENAGDIIIGSDDCDVYIYHIRAYESELTDEQILTNFIADSLDAETMIERYKRNQIFNDSGILTPDSVAEACPQLKIIKIEAPYFTNDKKNFVKDTKIQCIHKGGDAKLDNWIITNAYHAGQGTTSNEYGYAARNLDLIFNCDGIHPPNDKIEAISDYISAIEYGDGTKITDGTGAITLTRTSIPTNWLNIKVNVASSENANNALLQKRYNDFIPYISLAQKRNPFTKNAMEFVNCVVFIRETDTDVSTHREHRDTDWHFYAIGNIGDSKKTDYSRAYDQTDMNEFTLEISDNTLNNSTFQSGVYIENGQRVIENEKDIGTHTYVYPILPSEWNETNKRFLTLYADAFDGGSSTFPVYDADGNPTYDDKSEIIYSSGSFELRYGCCGDFKDGKLVNKTDENKAQLKINADVWRAFYRWVITSTDSEFIKEFEEWCNKDSFLYWYNFTHHFTMIDNRAKNTFWHFARTGVFRKVSKPVKELLHIYCEYDSSSQTYIKTMDKSINTEKSYFTEYQFDMWDYDNDR